MSCNVQHMKEKTPDTVSKLSNLAAKCLWCQRLNIIHCAWAKLQSSTSKNERSHQFNIRFPSFPATIPASVRSMVFSSYFCWRLRLKNLPRMDNYIKERINWSHPWWIPKSWRISCGIPGCQRYWMKPITLVDQTHGQEKLYCWLKRKSRHSSFWIQESSLWPICSLQAIPPCWFL